MAVIRWGILGTARINRLLIPAIRASGRSTLVAVASRGHERATAYASEWNIPRAHSSYDSLLSSGVDVVYIPLPNNLHVPWALRALAAGKHVLCEKPLALEPGDVDALAAAAAAHGRVVTEGFMYRHHAQTHRVKELIDAGAVGTVRGMLGGYTYMQSRQADIRLDPSMGGGALWDVGCYPVSFANLLAGANPLSVSGTSQVGPTGVDEAFMGTIVYANGIWLQIHAGFRAAHQMFMRIVGTDGIMEIARPFRPEPLEQITIRRDHGIEQIAVHGAAIFEDEVADMEDTVLGIRPSRITLSESRTLAATLAALHRSGRERCQIAV